MATSSTRRDRPQRYTVRLEVHLDPGTQTKIMRFVSAFRRRQSVVLRHVLEWSISHGPGWKLDRHRPPGRAQRVSLWLEPEQRERVEEMATIAGGDIPAWLRHAIRHMTQADFPASWQAGKADTRGTTAGRSHDSRYYGKRFMLRLDDQTWQRLEGLARDFDRSIAEVIRQLVMQARPEHFPQSWHLAAAEHRRGKEGRSTP